ncbi:MAG: DNA recombination protein RmuC [Gammaproteobacteria bacterium]|nr:DNA recombination protein RmuC [Gammaproteobacteria bacterium]
MLESLASHAAILLMLLLVTIAVSTVLLVVLFKTKNTNRELSIENSQLLLQQQNLSAQHETVQSQLTEAQQTTLNFQTQVQLAQQELARTQADKHGLETRLQERDQRLEQITLELKQQQQTYQQDTQRLQSIQNELSNELTELKTSLTEKQQHFEQQKKDIETQKQQLKTEFSNLANQILEEKGKSFSQSNKSELDAILKPFKEQVEGFQKRVNEVHSESVRGQAGLAAELKKVLEVGVKMSDDATNLATALKGEKKTAGNWGEVQLERTLQLAGLMKGDHYETQEKFVDGDGNRRLPDFVIKLPDDKHIIIDSKVSLVAYDKAIAANNELETNAALDEHVGAVKNHIDDLSKKDYSNLVGMRSPSFVLMFMPIEPAYIEALKHKKDLFNYGYDRNVILVSHTTLMPILKTVANLWRIEQGNVEAKEISERAGEIFNQVCLVAERLQKLGNTLNTASKQYNETVKGIAGKQGLHGKVERFERLSNKVSKSMPKLEANHADIDYDRLDLIVESVSETETPAKLEQSAEEPTQ